MITLDYQTNNRRWGLSGMKFSDWVGFAKVLGYLSNLSHYTINNGLVKIIVEDNPAQGADAEEGRILYYGTENFLSTNFPDLYNHKSAGHGRITYRINSNDYINCLINEFGFTIASRQAESTADVYPPQNGTVTLSILSTYISTNYPNVNINDVFTEYNNGWNL